MNIFQPKEKCGRPTRSGAPCKEWRAPAEMFDPERWQAGGCIQHLTDEERHLRDASAARSAAFEASFPEQQEPACWSWPVPLPSSSADEQNARRVLADFHGDRGCAICGYRGRLVTDHDHATGLVRGKLCRSCNTSEGMGSVRPAFVKYRERHPAAILGVRVRYWDPIYGFAEPDPPRPDLVEPIDIFALPRPEDLTRTETTK